MAIDKEQLKAVKQRWRAGRHIWMGMITLVVLVGGVGAWSAFASITGAVVAIGKLKVESNRQVVQHLDGGVVKEIRVKEGDVVAAGEPLLRLDDKLLQAELTIVEDQLHEILARRGRLTAVRDNLPDPLFEDEILEVAKTNARVKAMVDGQVRLYRARVETVKSETEQLRERQTQIGEEITGSRAQQEALERQLDLVGDELDNLRELLRKGLAQASRVLALERENARLLGEKGELISNVARLKGQISEIEIQLIGLQSGRVEEAITQLRDLEFRENELRERRNSLLETIDRLEIRAPRPGVVIGMTVYALRSVVRPAEPILYIVPSDVKLVIESRIDATSIDQVYPGQEARLRFSAFSTRTTPDVPGRIVKISPDVFTDDATGASYYTVELGFEEKELAALGDVELVAGMPVEAYITTTTRTPYSYFTKPLTDYFNKALRED
ncbi:MAG: HlyD family type I secretion periplasmic adaptor subunit [Pikeienuella sp.]